MARDSPESAGAAGGGRVPGEFGHLGRIQRSSSPPRCSSIRFDVLHWFLGWVPVRAVGYGGRKIRTWRKTMDHLSLSYEWPDGMYVNYEAN